MSRPDGVTLTAISLIHAHLDAAFASLDRPEAIELELSQRAQTVLALVRRQLPDMPIGDIVEVNRALAHHAVAGLALRLGTNDPASVTDWLERRLTALNEGGSPIEITGAQLLRAFAPGLGAGGKTDTSAAAPILARADGAELAIYLAEFAARMYAHAFGPTCLVNAQAALTAFVSA